MCNIIKGIKSFKAIPRPIPDKNFNIFIIDSGSTM